MHYTMPYLDHQIFERGNFVSDAGVTGRFIAIGWRTLSNGAPVPAPATPEAQTVGGKGNGVYSITLTNTTR